MSSAENLSDGELRDELIRLGFKAGPVTATTRKLYEKKLDTLRKNSQKSAVNGAVASKATPVKNNAAAQPKQLPTTPTSIKRRGRKPQVLESSDNELDLTVSSSINSSPISRCAGQSNRRIEAEVGGNRTPEHAPLAVRTPTPPRSSRRTRTPIRNENLNLSNSLRGNIFANAGSATTSPFAHGGPADDEEDDHMETSRKVPQFNPYGPHISGNLSGFRSSMPGVSSKDSPMDKLRRLSKGAWGYFSRPNATSTPCSEILKNVRSNGSTTRRYSRYGPNSSVSSRTAKAGTFDGCDLSGCIIVVCVVFLAMILGSYIWAANPETIQATSHQFLDASKTFFHYFYAYFFIPAAIALFVLILAGGAYQVNKYRENKRKERQVRLMDLVDRITGIIRDNEDNGVPELYARDILMPPTKRTNDDWALWQEAAAFINMEDSRVRTEVRLVNGDECNVWVWVPTASHKWQGAAVDERSLSHHVPAKALSRCIKLRGITFNPRPAELNNLRTELLHKLCPIVPVHMDFVHAPDNVVYLMLKSLADAKSAFMMLHSQWFQGGMISAKYLRDERYMERFPESAIYYN